VIELGQLHQIGRFRIVLFRRRQRPIRLLNRTDRPLWVPRLLGSIGLISSLKNAVQILQIRDVTAIKIIVRDLYLMDWSAHKERMRHRFNILHLFLIVSNGLPYNFFNFLLVSLMISLLFLVDISPFLVTYLFLLFLCFLDLFQLVFMRLKIFLAFNLL
jgi:hypothetical protein